MYSEGCNIFQAIAYDRLCSVLALLAFQGAKHRSSLFYFNWGFLQLAARFNEAFSTVEVNPTSFGSHSFWIGAATAAAKEGLPDSTIKRLPLHSCSNTM